MQAPRLIGTLLTHRASGANVTGLKEPDASESDLFLFGQPIDDQAQHSVERALLTHFEQQALE